MLSLAGCLQPVPKPQPPAEIKKVTAAKRMNEKLKLTAKQLRRKRISTEKIVMKVLYGDMSHHSGIC